VAEKATETKAAAAKAAKEVKESAAKAAKEVKETATKAAAKTTKAATKKATEVKETAAKTATKAAKTTKAAAKKAVEKVVKVNAVVNFQFAGKSYTTDDLIRIAKDVWKYDLNQKEADFKTVELYVKPEESLAYYVINGKFTGNFFI